MKWVKRILLLAVLAGAGWFLWTTFFPSPERVIRKRLAELERVASFGPNEGELARIANAGELAGFFTSDTEIIVDLPGYESQNLQGRDRLYQAALAVRSRMQGLDVDLLDVTVQLAPNRRTARVNLTAKANLTGVRDFGVQELEFEMVRDGRNWLIKRVVTIRTLS